MGEVVHAEDHFHNSARAARGWHIVLDWGSTLCITSICIELRRAYGNTAIVDEFKSTAMSLCQNDTPFALWKHLRATARRERGELRRKIFFFARLWLSLYERDEIKYSRTIVSDNIDHLLKKVKSIFRH